MKANLSSFLLVATITCSSVYADTFGSGMYEFVIEFIDIGYVGNDPQSSTNRAHSEPGGDGYGKVDYNYRIGKYEITLEQFNKALNADSRIGDGDEGYWNDGVRTVGTNAPASYVNWYEAAKFCNWLTTGDAYLGVYQFDGGGSYLGIDRSFRNESNLAYVIPSANEWHKAAYFKPDGSGYTLYANGLDSVPVHGTMAGWNYYSNAYVNGAPNYTWEVGFGGEEQNGTFDMMGNVREWNENTVSTIRMYRGGVYSGDEVGLRSSSISGQNPTTEHGSFGLRVACLTESPLTREAVIYTAVEIGWVMLPGETYQLQYSTNLLLNDWIDMGDSVIGDGSTNYVFDTVRGEEKRFYRVYYY